MRRVVILGNAGAGKTTLAKRLAARIGAPVVHLDAHFWQPGWQPTPRAEWTERVRALAAQDSWVMDGNYAATLGLRLSRADTVVVLDLPRAQCLYRVVRRGLLERGRSRSDLAVGCREQMPDRAFLRWIWRFPTDELEPMLREVDTSGAGVRRAILRSSREIATFLASGYAGLPG
jgi:adenylate kinase family enzyme